MKKRQEIAKLLSVSFKKQEQKIYKIKLNSLWIILKDQNGDNQEVEDNFENMIGPQGFN